VLYWIARAILGLAAKALFAIRVEGAERVPEQGPVVLCANHISWWDPVIVAITTRRPVHFMAKTELFRYPLFGSLLRMIHAFPVDRGKPDLSAIRDSISVLKSGNVLGVFPEGTRQRGKDALGEMHPGAALVALRTHAPVIPVAIRGPYGFRKTVTIAYGDPLSLEGETGRLSKDMQQGAKTIEDAIRALWQRLGEEVA